MNRLEQTYLRLLWQQKGFALLGGLLALITAFSGVALLAVSGWFISAAALAGLSAVLAHGFDFFSPGALVRGLSMSRTAGRYGERIITHEATFRLISKLRGELFLQLARRAWVEQPLNRHEAGSRLLQDIQNIESIYLSALVPSLVALSVSLSFLLALVWVQPALVLWMLPWLLLSLLLLPWLYSVRVTDAESALQSEWAQLWLLASTLFSSLRTLTLFGRLDAEGERLLAHTEQADRQEAAAVDRQQWVLLLAQISTALMSVVLLWRGVLAYQAGTLEGSYLFALLLLGLGVAEVLVAMAPAVAALALGRRALARLQALLGELPERGDTRQFGPAAERPCVSLCELNYRYPTGKRALFDSLSCELAGPAWFWVRGESGAGKSTLLRLLGGQLAANRGAIELMGIGADQWVLMPQSIDLLRSSLRENLRLHRPIEDAQLWQVLALVELEAWARALPKGLDTWVGEGEWQPSGGELKRIGLARVLLADARLILLDEPTAGMDPELTQRIIHRLAKQWQDQLVLVNSHDHEVQLAHAQSLTLTPAGALID